MANPEHNVSPMEVAGAVTNGITLAICLMESAKKLKEVYADANRPMDEDYWKLKAELYQMIVEYFMELRREQDELQVVEGFSEGNRTLEEAIGHLDNYKGHIESVQEDLNTQLDAAKSTYGRIRHGTSAVLVSMFGGESKGQVVKRVFEETLTVLVRMQLLLQGYQISTLNRYYRHFIAKVGNGLVALPQITAMLSRIESAIRPPDGSLNDPFVLSAYQIDATSKWVEDKFQRDRENMEVDISYFDFSQNGPQQLFDVAQRTPALFQCDEYQVQGFIEWIPWIAGEPGAKTKVSKQIRGIAAELGTRRELTGHFPESVSLSHCHGFFLNNRHNCYGMFLSSRSYYRRVSLREKLEKPFAPTTLSQSLSAPTRVPNKRQKLEAAKSLIDALFILHSVEIHHKAFMSKNILLLNDKGLLVDSDAEHVRGTMHLAGFSQARFAERYSDHSQITEDDEIYLPWRYILDRSATKGESEQKFFRAKYDLFGLGIVCAEICLWKPIISILSNYMDWGEPGSRRAMHAKWKIIQDGIVGQCKSALGEKFSEIVEWCLVEGSIGGPFGDHKSHLGQMTQQINKIEGILRSSRIMSGLLEGP